MRIDADSASLLQRQLSPDGLDPHHQQCVGPAAHAVDQLQQVQRSLQLLVAQLPQSEPWSLTGEIGPPPEQVLIERKNHSVATLRAQAIDHTADRRPHRLGEIRHGQLGHDDNLAAGFAGDHGRRCVSIVNRLDQLRAAGAPAALRRGRWAAWCSVVHS